jgi:lipopolysaccharide export system permease protein
VRHLDRYVLREQLAALAAGLVFFVSIFVVVDVFEKIDTFLDNQVPLATVLLYYLVSIPGIILQVLPMAMLLSCLIALGQIGRSNELTAMRAAGIGPARIAAPILIAAFLTSALVFVTNEIFLPHLNARRTEILRVDIRSRAWKDRPCGPTSRIWGRRVARF